MCVCVCVCVCVVSPCRSFLRFNTGLEDDPLQHKHKRHLTLSRRIRRFLWRSLDHLVVINVMLLIMLFLPIFDSKFKYVALHANTPMATHRGQMSCAARRAPRTSRLRICRLLRGWCCGLSPRPPCAPNGPLNPVHPLLLAQAPAPPLSPPGCLLTNLRPLSSRRHLWTPTFLHVWHLKRAIGKCIVSWIDAKTYNEVHASRRLTFFYDGNHSCIVAVAVAVTAALRFLCSRIIRNLCSCSSETASTCVVDVLFWKMCLAALAGHTFWEVPNPTSCATAAAAASRLIHTFYFFWAALEPTVFAFWETEVQRPVDAAVYSRHRDLQLLCLRYPVVDLHHRADGQPPLTSTRLWCATACGPCFDGMCAALTCGVVQCNRGNGPPQAMDFSPQGFTQSLNITQSGENGTSVGTWTAAAPVNHRFDFIQTLYFTLTSFSTVGYATLQPRDPGQRLRGQHLSPRAPQLGVHGVPQQKGSAWCAVAG